MSQTQPVQLDLVNHLFEQKTNETGITFIEGRDNRTFLSYKSLKEQACIRASQLARYNLKEGSQVILPLENNYDFLCWFWACIISKLVPVPTSTGVQKDQKKKVLNIWNSLEEPVILSSKSYINKISESIDESKKLRKFWINSEVEDGKSDFFFTKVYSLSDLLFIQFSSGSTGSPKGIKLTHQNILSNCGDIIERSKISPADSMLSWMPLTHDMGMICFHLTALLAGINQVILPTSLFIRSPGLWMSLASELKSTLLFSPNFGLKYYRDWLSKQDKIDLDLSEVRLIFNGAEQISKSVCDQFYDSLRGFGLQQVIFPGYGMAEASVAVSLPDPGDAIRTHKLDRTRLNVDDQILISDEGVEFVELGYPMSSTHVRVTSDKGQLEEGHVGRIEITGANVSDGYFQNEEATRSVFTSDKWLKTGDLGFIIGGRLTIVGREKNLIIINGQNYLPHDLENHLINDIEFLELGKVVGTSILNQKIQGEELVIFLLIKQVDGFDVLAKQVIDSIEKEYGITPSVAAVRQIPKTTSGKIQYYKLREDFLNGSILLKVAENNNVDINSDEQFRRALREILLQSGIKVDQYNQFRDVPQNSIDRIRLVNKINRLTEKSIQYSDLAELSSVDQIVKLINTSDKRETRINSIEDQDYFQINESLKQIWLFDSANFDNARSLVSLACTLKATFSEEKIQRSYYELIKQHTVLRSSIEEFQDGLVFKTREVEQVEFHLQIELNPGRLGLNDFEKVLFDFNNEPFDLSNEKSLIRLLAIKLSDNSIHLSFVTHHIVSDGWSLYKIIESFSNHYLGLKSTSTYQYQDFLVWRKHQNDQNSEHWQKILLGKEYINFPQIGSTKPSDRVKSIEFGWDPNLVANISDFANDNLVTISVVILSAVGSLLAKMIKKEKIVMQSDHHGRISQDLESMVGYMLISFPIVMEDVQKSTFNQLVRSLEKYMENCVNHFPTQLNHKKNSSLNDFLILFQNLNENIIIDPEVKQHIEIDYASQMYQSMVKLLFEFILRDEQLLFKITFEERYYSESQFVQFNHLLQEALSKFIGKPQAPIETIHYLGTGDFDRLKALSEGEQRVNTLGLVEHFSSTVLDNKDRIAISDGETQITYRCLDILSDNVRDNLIEFDDKIIGVILSRDVFSIIVLFGIIKAGLKYVSIDPLIGQERIDFLIKDSGINLIILSNEEEVKLNKVLTINPQDLCNENRSINGIKHNGQGGYLMYTSGSTGLPKGVVVSEQGIYDYALTFAEVLNLNSTDIIAHQSSLSFDTSIEEIFPILLQGGKLIIIKEGNRDVARLGKSLDQFCCTILSSLPIIFRSMFECRPTLSSIRWIISGGESLQNADIQWIRIQNSNIRFLNSYGPTETIVCASYFELTDINDTIPIGKPITNKSIYILDDEMNLLPEWMEGEIWIGGKHLAEGYLNKSDMTNSRFLSNPFAQGQIYKTGDIGYRDGEGNIHFAGRRDRQVKIRGYRIELEEIESIVRQIQGVDECRVKVAENEGINILVGYYTGPIKSEQIEADLIYRLPHYMLPAGWMKLDSFNKSAGGKIIESGLPEFNPLLNRSVDIGRNENEILLQTLWKKVLGFKVGVKENFFQIGGHSLKAVELANTLRKRGFNVSLRHIFTYSTISEFSQYLIALKKERLPSIKRIEDQEYYELSSGQWRLWIQNQISGDLKAYNMLAQYEIEGEFNNELFKKAVIHLVEKIEILRTRILVIEGEVFQRVETSFDIDRIYIYHDLRGFCIEDKQKWLEDRLEIERNRRFDLEKVSPLTVQFHHYSDNKVLLQFNLSHIVADGWSTRVLLNELMTIYEQLGSENPLSFPHQVQFKDYTSWTKEALAASPSKDFWIKYLLHSKPLELESNRSKPKTISYAGSEIITKFDDKTVKNIFHLAGSESTSTFTILLSALVVLFHKYSDENDITIGIPVLGRSHPELENQVGFFINLIAFRTQLNPDTSFLDYINEVKDNLFTCYNHQDYPFDKVIEDLNLERTPGTFPLFNILVAFEDFVDDNEQVYDNFKIVDSLFPHNGSSKYDLTITFSKKKDELFLKLEYSSDLYESDYVGELAQNYMVLTDSIFKNVNQQIKQISFLNNITINKLTSWQGEKISVEDNLFDLLREGFIERGDKIAIVDKESQISYHALFSEVCRIAVKINQELTQQNSQTIVGVVGHKDLHTIIFILSLLKAGKAFLPLDPDIPEKRLEYVIEDSGIDFIYSSKKTFFVENVELIYAESFLATKSDENGSIDFKESDGGIAYTIYTSGSTGKPKGVIISRLSLVNFLKSMKEGFKLAENQRSLLLTSFSFDISILELFLPLINGNTLLIADRKDPKLESWLINYQPDLVQSTPSLWLLLAKFNWEKNRKVTALVGGEQMTHSHLRLLSGFTDSVHNMYGPTETTIWSSYHTIDSDEIHVGRPIYNTTFHVLNKNLELLPVNVPGDLYIGGLGLGEGYLNNPSLTHEKFIKYNGERIYNTGDRAFWNSSGKLVIAGRKDDQVKIRGNRVELTEIEQVIRSYPGILDLSIVYQNSIQTIHCFFVSNKGFEINDVKDKIIQFLPEYMIPSFWIEVDSIPLNSNGKADKKKLLSEYLNSNLTPQDIELPQNETEKLLLDIWQEVLPKNEFGVTDSLFSIGGHSLSAMQIVARYNAAAHNLLTVADIFTYQTIRGLSKYLSSRNESIDQIQLVAIEEQDYYQASYSQYGIWLACQLSEKKSLYNVSHCYELSQVNLSKFTAAWKELIKGYEILRTGFEYKNKILVQRIKSPEELDFNLIRGDITGFSDQEIEKELNKEREFEFDLSNPLLFRCALLEKGEDNYLLIVTFHHIIIDGWSLNHLFAELISLYNKAKDSIKKEIQFKDISAWQNQRVDQMEQSKEYWINHIQSIELNHTDIQQLDGHIKSNEGKIIYSEIGDEQFKRVYQYSKKIGISPGTLLYAISNLVLQFTTQKKDLVLAMPVSGRTVVELENQVGYFLNTLPLQIPVNEDQNFDLYLNEVSSVLTKSLQHQEYPYDRMISDQEHGKLEPDFLFVYNDFPNFLSYDKAPFDISYRKVDRCNCHYRISLIFTNYENRLQVEIEYDSLFYEKSFIDTLINTLAHSIQSLIDIPTQQIKTFQFLNEKERARILEISNGRNRKNQGSIFSHLLKSINNYKDRIAADDGEVQLTYGCLNDLIDYASNRIYQMPDTVIGIMLNRDVSMLVILLAIIKSGKRYLPIDPFLGQERIDYMLKDSQVKTLILSNNFTLSSEDLNLIDPSTLIKLTQDKDTNIDSSKEGGYIMYTSGSTGKPKGVIVNQVSILDYAISFAEKVGLNHSDVMVQQSSLSFDTSVEEIFPTLLRGGKLIITRDGNKDIGSLGLIIERHCCTILSTLPLILGHLKAYDPRLDSIRWIVSGGDILNSSDIYWIHNKYNSIRFLNSYGPTEGVICASFHELSELRDNIPIGKPIDNKNLYILDDAYRILPAWVPGEIWIGSEYLANGYVNKLAETKKKFMDDPFQIGNGLMYKTGDRAVRDHAGVIYYLGRNDRQVKVRGYRIELEEIENALITIEQIDECRIIYNKIGERDFLLAYFRGSCSVDSIQKKMYQLLPYYMQPDVYHQVEEFTKSPGGKILDSGLPTIEIKQQQQKSLPRNELEQTLVAIWVNLLGTDVGVNDNFFQKGGHSLKAFELSSILKNLGYQVSLPDIFQFPTIAQLAASLSNQVTLEKTPSISAIEEQQYYRLSPGQWRLWIQSNSAQGSNAYNMFGAYSIKGDFDPKIFVEALELLVSKYEILRTKIITIEGSPYQQVVPLFRIKDRFSKVDLTNKEFSEIEEILKNFQEEGKDRVFDLNEPGQFRIELIKIDSSNFVIHFNIHHIISDGWSSNLMIIELFNFYDQIKNKSLIHSNSTLHYKDYCAWINTLVENMQPSLNFWERYMEGAKQLQIPADFPRSSVSSNKGSERKIELDEQTNILIKDLSGKLNVSPYVIFLSVINLVLSNTTRQSDIVIGLPVLGREHESLDNQLGFFVNMIPFRSIIDSSTSIYQFIIQTRNNLLACVEHQNLPFERIIKMLGVNREKNRSPLFDVVISFEENSDFLTYSGYSVKEHSVSETTSKYDIVCNINKLGGNFGFQLVYSTELYSDERMKMLADGIVMLLNCLNQDNPIDDLINHLDSEYLDDIDFKVNLDF